MKGKVVIESPVIKEIVEQVQAACTREVIEEAILLRFTKLSGDARARLQGVTDDDKLRGLHRFAILCPTLEVFVDRLNWETTPAEKASSRRKWRNRLGETDW